MLVIRQCSHKSCRLFLELITAFFQFSDVRNNVIGIYEGGSFCLRFFHKVSCSVVDELGMEPKTEHSLCNESTGTGWKLEIKFYGFFALLLTTYCSSPFIVESLDFSSKFCMSTSSSIAPKIVSRVKAVM